jgi:hypothetical protein
MIRVPKILLCSAPFVGLLLACSTSDNGGASAALGGNSGRGGGSSGSASAGAGASGSAMGSGGLGAAAGSSPTLDSGGSSGAGAGSVGTGGGAGTRGGSGGSSSVSTGTPPTCATPTPSPNDARAGECDYLQQSIDFEDKFSYPTTLADVRITNFGSAFGQTAINNCSPYCYDKNLTVGVDIVGGGSAAQVQGEVIVEFPKTGTGLPITVADMTRNSLAWISFDGPSKPAFEIDTQLVIETAMGPTPSVESKPFFKSGGNLAPFGPFNVTNNYSYDNGSEFKYFAVTSANGFPTPLTNVTGIGFRITAKASAGQEWHGVAYIDHLQVRGAGGNNPTDAGAYPFGL